MLAILKHLKNKCAIRKNKVNEIKYGKEFLNFKNINSSINKNTKWMVIHRKKSIVNMRTERNLFSLKEVSLKPHRAPFYKF